MAHIFDNHFEPDRSGGAYQLRGRYDYICFRDSDLDKLPTNDRPGSMAVMAHTGTVFVLTDTQEWLEFGSGFEIEEPNSKGGK